MGRTIGLVRLYYAVTVIAVISTVALAQNSTHFRIRRQRQTDVSARTFLLQRRAFICRRALFLTTLCLSAAVRATLFVMAAHRLIIIAIWLIAFAVVGD